MDLFEMHKKVRFNKIVIVDFNKMQRKDWGECSISMGE